MAHKRKSITQGKPQLITNNDVIIGYGAGAKAKARWFRDNKHRAVKHTFKQYRYIKFLNKKARKRLNPKFTIQSYPKH